MPQMTSGSCQCGAVRFEIEGSFDSFFLCHCSRCRKDTGSAHASNLFSSTATLTWRSGQEKIAHYKIPATRHARSFCSVCGSGLPNIQMDGALLVVPAGSLDDDVDISPIAHICFASRAGWDEAMGDIPKIDGLPA
ncbi:GFA family protein [Sphingomonas montanisoli]|uniref:GFA family protein n=1 Tax=Sphingomonas montanisoli TaxID=2606412 RepID=A0A5D9CBP2_9SPHN|nr:GFA family protein [Sphingomonas montanisoli]TZG28786.1 GFA family protein [Sphingomonas montanisoli]